MPTAPTGYALGSGSTTYGSLYSLTAAAGYQGVATQYISQTSSSRGLNVLVFTNSAQTSWTAYDTHGSTAASDSLATMLNGLANGVFVAIACFDSCAASWTANLQTALTRIGGSIQSDTISGGTLSLRDQYILVAQVGTSSLTVQEERNRFSGSLQREVTFNGGTALATRVWVQSTGLDDRPDGATVMVRVSSITNSAAPALFT